MAQEGRVREMAMRRWIARLHPRPWRVVPLPDAPPCTCGARWCRSRRAAA